MVVAAEVAAQAAEEARPDAAVVCGAAVSSAGCTASITVLAVLVGVGGATGKDVARSSTADMAHG